MAQMPAMGAKRTSLKIHSLQFATAPCFLPDAMSGPPPEGERERPSCRVGHRCGDAIFELGMRPTSEAWPMSARVATARQPLDRSR